MHRIGFIRIPLWIAALLILAVASVQADELTLTISTTDTVRAGESAGSVQNALVIPEIPKGDSIYIDFAELIVPISADVDSTDPLLLLAAPILKSWTPGQEGLPQLLSEEGEGFDPGIGGLRPIGETTEEREIHIDVTSLVTLWQQEKLANHGLLIKSITEQESSFSLIKDGRYNGGHAKLRIMYCKP